MRAMLASCLLLSVRTYSLDCLKGAFRVELCPAVDAQGKAVLTVASAAPPGSLNLQRPVRPYAFAPSQCQTDMPAVALLAKASTLCAGSTKSPSRPNSRPPGQRTMVNLSCQESTPFLFCSSTSSMNVAALQQWCFRQTSNSHHSSEFQNLKALVCALGPHRTCQKLCCAFISALIWDAKELHTSCHCLSIL